MIPHFSRVGLEIGLQPCHLQTLLFDSSVCRCQDPGRRWRSSGPSSGWPRLTTKRTITRPKSTRRRIGGGDSRKILISKQSCRRMKMRQRTSSLLQVVSGWLHRCALSACTSGLSLHLVCCCQVIWGITNSGNKEECKQIMHTSFGWCPSTKVCSTARVLLLLLAVFLASLVVCCRISTRQRHDSECRGGRKLGDGWGINRQR